MARTLSRFFYVSSWAIVFLLAVGISGRVIALIYEGPGVVPAFVASIAAMGLSLVFGRLARKPKQGRR